MLLGFLDPSGNSGSPALRPITRSGDTPPSLAFVQELLGGAVEPILTVTNGDAGSVLLYGCADRGTHAATCRIDSGLLRHREGAVPDWADATIYGPVLLVGVDLVGGHRSLSEEEFSAFTLVADVHSVTLPILHFRAFNDDPG